MYKRDLSYGLFLSDQQLDFLFNYPQGFDRIKCLATFMRMAVMEPMTFKKKGLSVDLTTGQFAISEVELAKLWKCNRKTVSKIATLFNDIGLVTSETSNRTTIFTVKCVACWYCKDRQIVNKHYTPIKQILSGVHGDENRQTKPKCELGDIATNASKNYSRQIKCDENLVNDGDIRIAEYHSV